MFLYSGRVIANCVNTVSPRHGSQGDGNIGLRATRWTVPSDKNVLERYHSASPVRHSSDVEGDNRCSVGQKFVYDCVQRLLWRVGRQAAVSDFPQLSLHVNELAHLSAEPILER